LNIRKRNFCWRIEGWPVTKEVFKRLAFIHTIYGWRYLHGPALSYVVNAFQNPVEIEDIDYEPEEDD
jgi:hypothetical protein